MEQKWKIEKGNNPEMPTVYKSEHPINKEQIDEKILNFIYKVFTENSSVLKVSDFEIEFLCFGEMNGFLKLKILSGNGKEIEVNLRGDTLKEFISLVRDTNFGDFNINQPPSSN